MNVYNQNQRACPILEAWTLSGWKLESRLIFFLNFHLKTFVKRIFSVEHIFITWTEFDFLHLVKKWFQYYHLRIFLELKLCIRTLEQICSEGFSLVCDFRKASKGPFINYVTHLVGGSSNCVTKFREGGRGGWQK